MVKNVREEPGSLSEDWLKVGVELFSKEGNPHMEAAMLSRALGRSSTEFYRLFKDEEYFLYRMVEYWRKVKTTRIIESFAKLSYKARLEKLVDMVFADRSLHDFLFYLRKQAQKDGKLATLLADIEEERIDSTRHIFNGLGFGVKEIDLKGELLYSFYLGWYERYKYQPFTPALRKQVLEQIEYLVGIGD
ncbi:TetR/AcrR family transcriptional regulator [Nafulsella turpanensis]|uniref:TetR/AcrR family transcriptional regulator n=1 Tax=Nafulsella turpanensis TaxID=1265690 RepID=UPI00034BB462|nr:TetR/AcrR family transcriptional regulator [Nafulsella turpanensis]